MMRDRIYLSPPHVDDKEQQALTEALNSGWVAPVGPQLASFENQLTHRFSGKKALLLNSGTSALHTSLVLSGVKENDDVLTSSLTFAACANVILYQGAIPVFFDSESETWNMDPDLLSDYLEHTDKKPKAIIVTHLYGVPAKIRELTQVAKKYNVTLIEDAAEALGASFESKPVGSFGDFGIISFNGNKIITTSAGGALICNEQNYLEGLHLATQANRGNGEYDHDMVGYNYRMSNILAGLGEAQLHKLDSFLLAKKQIFDRYKTELSEFMEFPNEMEPSRSNYWLSTCLIHNDHSPVDLITWLDEENIEARRLWKPLHLHTPYRGFEFIGEGICESLFMKGICLPSGSGLTNDQQSKVIDSIKRFFRR